jgi:hypothetical protein
MTRLILLLACLSILLTGCGKYSVSEAELNQALDKTLSQPLTNSIKVSKGEEVIELTMQVSTADLMLTSEQGGLIQLTLSGQLTGSISLFSRTFSLTSQMTQVLETGIRLEQESLYLVGAKIVSLKVDGTGFQDQMLTSVLPSIQDDIEKAINDYLNNNAVYQLEHSLIEKGIAKFATQISVKQENLELSLF